MKLFKIFIFHLKYVETAQKLCLSLEKNGYWADFIDPSSGRPVSFNHFILNLKSNLTKKEIS